MNWEKERDKRRTGREYDQIYYRHEYNLKKLKNIMCFRIFLLTGKVFRFTFNNKGHKGFIIT